MDGPLPPSLVETLEDPRVDRTELHNLTNILVLLRYCFSSVEFDQESWVGVVTSCWMSSKRSVRGAMERREPTR